MKSKLWLFLALASGVYGQSTSSALFTVIPKTDLSATGEIRWRDKQTSPHYVGFKAPDSVSANTIWVLPPADAVGCLQSDGALNLTVTTCGAASVINGFFVTGSSAVGPPVTSQGLQVWHSGVSHETNILSYDASNALSPINLSASKLNLTLTEVYPAVGGIDFGDITHSFNNFYLNDANVSTVIFKTTVPFLSKKIAPNSSDGKLYIVDSAANNIVSFDGGSIPTVDVKNSLKMSNLTGSITRCLHITASGFIGAATSDCGLDVTNGYIVSGKSTVAPPNTSMGIQMWYETSTHVAEIRAYDNANSPSQIDIVASLINPAVGGINLGDSTHGFNNAYIGQVIAGTYQFTNTGLFLPFHMGTNAVDGKLYVVDGLSSNIISFNGGATPTVAIYNSLKMENLVGSTTRCLHVTATGFVGPAIGDCGTGDVSNGYFVTGNSAVGSSTALGLQVAYDATAFQTNIKSYNGGNTLAPINIAAALINLTGNAIISAVGSAGPPLTLNGASATNGDVVINPGNVAASSKFLVQNARGDLPGTIIRNVLCVTSTNGCTSGVTTADAFEIQDSGGAVVFKVQGSANSTRVNEVDTFDVVPLGTTETKVLGSPTNRWAKLWVKDVDFSGTFTGTAPWVLKTGDTMSGNLDALVNGNLSLGSAVKAWGSTWALTNSSSRKFQVYDQSAADLTTSLFWSLYADNSPGSFQTVRFYVKDSNGDIALQLNRTFLGTATKSALLDGSWLPAIDNLYDIGDAQFGTHRWRNLYMTGDAFVRSLTCTNSPCGTNDVINGYFVTGNASVGPSSTSLGLQVAYDAAAHVAYAKVYDGSSILAPLNLSVSQLNLAGTASIAATGPGPFQLTGSGITSGAIMLNPVNAGSTPSVIVTAASLSQPALRIWNTSLAGSTTGNVFQIDTPGGGTPVFKVIGFSDSGCPNCLVSYSHNPHDTSGTDKLGDSAHRWGMFANTLDVSGVSTFGGNMTTPTVGTISLGSTANPWGSTFALTNSSSKKFQVYDNAATDLQGIFWAITAQDTSGIGATVRLKFTDSAGTDVLVLSSAFLGSPSKSGRLEGDWIPNTDATYSLGLSPSLRWKDLNITGAATVGSLTCTGSPCGAGGTNVANGFFVTGNSNVLSSTAQGYQLQFDATTSTALTKVYNGSNTISGFQLNSSTFDLGGIPNIRAVNGIGPLQLLGQTSSNGNILLTPGAVVGNASVRINQALGSQPALKIIGASGSTATTSVELDDNGGTARFWVEAAGNSSTNTGGPNYVHTASVYPTVDATYDLGAGDNLVPALKYRYVKAYAAQFGSNISETAPSGATIMGVGNGVNIMSLDAFGSGGGIPSYIGRSAGGTVTSPSATTINNVLLSFGGRGWVFGQFTTSASASVTVKSNENWGSAQGADIYFDTTASGQSFFNRTTRAIVTSTGINPGADNTYSLGSSGPCFNGGSSPCRWNSANIVNLTVGNCVGCGGFTSISGTSPISVSVLGTSATISCPTCASTSNNNTWSGTNQFSTITMAGDIIPDFATTRNLGSLFRPLNGVIANSIIGNSSVVTASLNVSTSMPDAHVGSGNFYLRTFSGAPSCSGVGDGWVGIDISFNRLWVCIGGIAKSANLL